jgi:Uncharacterized protein conserved in bacteria (DUF2219)
LSYERLWRLRLIGDNGFGVDIVPQLGASVGNILTYGAAGALLRIGTGLGADYGPVRIRPALSGTDYFDGDHLDEGKGYYFFAGTQARRRPQHLPRRQLAPHEPERPEEDPGGRCAGGILGAVVEIVAVRHKRCAAHGGVSRTAHPRRHLHSGPHFYLVSAT